MNGYVYLLINWDDGTYKIGISKYEDVVTKRIKSLQTGNGSEILLVRKYKSENYHKLEAMLHKRYYSQHKRGEWFNLTDEQANNFIETCEKLDNRIKLLLKENPFYK